MGNINTPDLLRFFIRQRTSPRGKIRAHRLCDSVMFHVPHNCAYINYEQINSTHGQHPYIPSTPCNIFIYKRVFFSQFVGKLY